MHETVPLTLQMKPASSADPESEQQRGQQRGQQREQQREPILGDTSLLALCAFLAVLLQLWHQGFSSSVC